jgi:hypothetical protein
VAQGGRSSLARYGTTSARREIAQRLTVMVREARLKPRCSFSLPGAGSGSPPAATDPRAGAVEGRRAEELRGESVDAAVRSRPPSCRLRESGSALCGAVDVAAGGRSTHRMFVFG